MSAAESGALGAQAQIDTGLVAVIQSWPRLLEAIRVGNLAMIRASD